MTEQQSQAARARRHKATGVVVADSRDKTIKVRVQTIVKHPQYGKYVRRRGVCQVHDENNEAHVGDKVEVMSCRPISKTKHWRLLRVLAKSRSAEPAAAKAGTKD